MDNLYKLQVSKKHDQVLSYDHVKSIFEKGHIRHGLNFLGKNYLSLDWHSRAKQLFYNEKAAEDIAQDKSFHDKSPAKKQQSVSLSECLELYTSKEQLGEDDAW